MHTGELIAQIISDPVTQNAVRVGCIYVKATIKMWLLESPLC